MGGIELICFFSLVMDRYNYFNELRLAWSCRRKIKMNCFSCCMSQEKVEKNLSQKSIKEPKYTKALTSTSFAKLSLKTGTVICFDALSFLLCYLLEVSTILISFMIQLCSSHLIESCCFFVFAFLFYLIFLPSIFSWKWNLMMNICR